MKREAERTVSALARLAGSRPEPDAGVPPPLEEFPRSGERGAALASVIGAPLSSASFGSPCQSSRIDTSDRSQENGKPMM